MIVAKFGGSSLADAEQFAKVKNIVAGDERRRVIAVSAPGKRNSADNKVTDLLYALETHLKHGIAYADIWNGIKSRYIDIKNKLSIDCDIEKELTAIEKTFSNRPDKDYLISRGEYLCAVLMSAWLGYTFVDAAELLCFDSAGNIDEELSAKRTCEAYKKYGSIVVPGFYGAYKGGYVRLLPRGGSDMTGAFLARFLDAELYENWTDVSGICAADPRLADNPRVISQITYAELRELSYMGAGVLHEDSVFPARQKNVPINIRNTNRPDEAGTLIVADSDSAPVVTGIAGKTGFMSLVMHKDNRALEIGFARKALTIFESHKINVEIMPTGIDLFSVTIDAQDVKHIHSVIAELEDTLDCRVRTEYGLALVTVVGHNMAGKAGVCAKVFSILGENGINVKLITQSPDENNIIIGINEKDYKNAVRLLYAGLSAAGMI